MKNILLNLMLTFFTAYAGCDTPPVQPPPGMAETAAEESPETVTEKSPQAAELPVSGFGEIWAYLVDGREEALDPDYPISDIGYFGAELDSYGKLTGVPDVRKISSFKGRKHLVAVCSGRALTHFALAEGSAERQALIRDLLDAAKPYDGLQIDYENVPPRDGEAFLSFLEELRAGLGNKFFSIALPARIRPLSEDVYSYTKIKPLVDRILVMAYDEHWSTSKPGPIASLDWCQRIAQYALETIGPEKLIMGLPLYGRSWGSVNANRAHLYSSVDQMIREQNITEIQRENSVPTFSYETPLSVTVYFEDEHSLSARLAMYKKMEVAAVGFWRLGQETPSFWQYLRMEAVPGE